MSQRLTKGLGKYHPSVIPHIKGWKVPAPLVGEGLGEGNFRVNTINYMKQLSNSSAPPPDLPPPPFSPSRRGTGGGNIPRWRGCRGWKFPPPLVGGVRGGGRTVTQLITNSYKCAFIRVDLMSIR